MRIELVIVFILFISCTDKSIHKELMETQESLAESQLLVNQLKELLDKEGELVHLVFFNTKDDIDEDAFLSQLQSLSDIKYVKSLELGSFKNLEDPRALSMYSHFMQMQFEDQDAYKSYQKDPLHLALKDKTKSFMAGPPATYDFTVK